MSEKGNRDAFVLVVPLDASEIEDFTPD
ncbi:MAG: hypothetical protein QOF33_3592, partial [Thermomicrobiales bacterium]|nr:hypothetical protein [Thermomicrobiales bacterium]